MEMKPAEVVSFLKAEYDKSFDMIIHIDNRRDRFASVAFVLFSALLGIVATLLKNMLEIDSKDIFLNSVLILTCSLLMFIGSISCILFRKVLLSERKANVRYRNKINLIREAILGQLTEDRDLRIFLNEERREKFGYKFFSDGEIQKNEIGGTLKPIFTALWVLFAIGMIMGSFLLIWALTKLLAV